MKKLILAAIAATIGMSAVAAEAGSLRFNNKALVRADINVLGARSEGRVHNPQNPVSVRLNWYATAFNVKNANGELVRGAQETVNICPEVAGYGCTTFTVPEDDTIRVVDLHGSVFGLWYTERTEPGYPDRQNGYGHGAIEQYKNGTEWARNSTSLN